MLFQWMVCHVIFGPPKYPDPRNEYFNFHVKYLFPLELFVPPFECVRIDGSTEATRTYEGGVDC